MSSPVGPTYHGHDAGPR